MLDFLTISTRSRKRGVIEIYPRLIIKKSSDLMIRGGDFYAVWVEERGLWSTDEQDALALIDKELDIFYKKEKDRYPDSLVKVLHMWDAESGMIDGWHKYCQKQMRDNFHMLDEKLIFSNSPTDKKDYASKRLPYPLKPGEIKAYDRLMSVLYSEQERKKIEWAIGAIVSGESKFIQKFMVLYGAAGTGKSTILNIIQDLFEGYYSTFDSKALGSSTNVFALESFRSNPLVAIQHDGDLSHIEDNTRINSLVSHELMTVNEKFKSTYSNRFKCFLIMGTNKPVRITDAKSGLIRRLIDVSPTGNKITSSEYQTLIRQVKFELGGIADHCMNVYLNNVNLYDDYIPINMLGASNDFYNFVEESYPVFKSEDMTTAAAAWEMYNMYCNDAKVSYPLSRRAFREELKNYFKVFEDRATKPLKDGTRPRNIYIGFRYEKFEKHITTAQSNQTKTETWLNFNDADNSIFDDVCSNCPAQYATKDGIPKIKWADVTSKLSDIDTAELHFVKVPENHIVIDFDIPDNANNKNFELNFEAASKWPPTYAELSKSGAGIHLHYIYSGDVSKLSRIYDEHIEIKIFTGGASLRRKLTKCNNLQIASINSGLPMKGADKLVNFKSIQSEKGLRTLIARNLKKEIHPGTKPSIDFIHDILNEAYTNGLHYDVTDMRNAILAFAANSTHKADYCIKLVNKMKFKSEEPSEPIDNRSDKLVFYDVEVFPNLFLVNWKIQGEGANVVRMINPSPTEIEELMKFRLVGFNCRRYDNHILYARFMGYNNEQLYNLSQRIIGGKSENCFFGEAYNVSYTDVLDFSSKKQSLKKFEIELGLHHQELGLPWDKPVPEEMWEKVAEYCDNDVLATEAVFNDRKADFIAREILADVAGMTVNDTTNSLTTRIIFGNNRKPQEQFNYRNMGDLMAPYECYMFEEPGEYENLPLDGRDTYNIFDFNKKPYFPGYKFENGKSVYRGEEVGEGGYVYAEPGIYTNVALLDIASMHPSSIVAENLFGDEYTSRFKELLDARIAIKHKEFDKARKMLKGALAKYLTDETTAKDLAQALKIAINSVYGLTSAKFDNAFRDKRNIDNIVAKRGALFMINLKHEVQKRGFIVAHIKTDSIKIPNATPEIIKFVTEYGEEYGYTFEHEATYEKMCLVNDAVYIAKYNDGDHEIKLSTGEKLMTPWTATGTQFKVPYVFKKLFAKAPIIFDDQCETKSVTSALYLDMNEQLSEEEHNYVFIGKVGQFCPIKSGCGGGLLMREKDGKYYAATGTKNYRWLESEKVKILKKESCIDTSYYEKMVDEAIKTISEYGDFKILVE